MRQIDQAERHAPLPPPIHKPADTAPPEQWAPIASQPGYERSTTGAVRKKAPDSLYEALFGRTP